MESTYPLGPQFRELEFVGEQPDIDSLVSAIEARLETPWSRAVDVESAPILAGKYRVFRRDDTDELPSALLHLIDDDRRLCVANIVPVEVGQLSIDQYNEILVEFAERFAQDAAPDVGLRAEVGPDTIDLGKELDDTTFRALFAFSRCSNRSTGSSHPMDRERWYDFMILLHRSSREVGTSVLQEFLMRDGWSESVAWDLAIEFEFGMGLLRRVAQH